MPANGALRVGHHAEDSAIFTENAGNVARRAVRILALRIAEGHTAITFERVQRGIVRKVIAVMMGHRDDDIRLASIGAGIGCIGGFDGQGLRAADKVKRTKT